MFPIFVENSRIPKIISATTPWNISAISLALFVFSREEISPVTKQHETIHFRQWLELGFLLFPLLYVFFYFRNRIIFGLNQEEAYYEIPFEREAYTHEGEEGYLEKRQNYRWLYYI